MAKYLEILLSTGQVDRMDYGPSKVYFPSQRVPVSSLMNFSSEMVIILDAKKRIIQINDRFLQCIKEKRELLVGQSFIDVPVPLVRTLADLRILKEPNMEKEASTELSFLTSGKKFYFKIKTLPTVFEDGGHGLTIIIENITQQKQYENDLIQNEARYRAIVEDQTELIYRRLPDGTITFVNGAFSRYFGKTQEELLGMNIHSLIPSLEQDQAIRNNAADNRLLHNDTYEQRVARENGAIQWLLWSDNELYDKTGVLNEIQSVGKDITLQKDREKEIIVKESVVASSGHAIAITDIMGRVVFANRAFISIIGYEEEHEVTGEPLEKFVRRTGIQDNISQITAAMIQKGEWNGTATARKKDGTEFELEVYASMIADDQHFPRNMIALFNNADPHPGRKKPGQSLYDSGQSDKKGIAVIDATQELHEKTRKVIEFIPYPTFVIDHEKRVVAWNRALELMTNVKRQDVIGTNNYAKAFSFYQHSRPILVDVLGLSGEEVARQYPEVRRYGDCIFMEGFIPVSDGVHEAYLWGKASPLLDPDGNIIGAIESVQDISDWKKMQVSLKRMRDEINGIFVEKIQQLRKNLDFSDI